MRIDRLMLFLRFTKSRSLAQKWVSKGHFRRNGERIARPGQEITNGDILTLPLRSRVMVIEILSLPTRRGPAEETQSCYRELDAGRTFAVAGANGPQSEGHHRS